MLKNKIGMAICGIIFGIFLIIIIESFFSDSGIPLLSELFILFIILFISFTGFMAFRERDKQQQKISELRSVDPKRPQVSSKVIPLDNQMELRDKRNVQNAVMKYECTKCEALFSTPSRVCPKCGGPMIGIKK